MTIANGVARALQGRPGDAVDLVPTIDTEAVRHFVRALDKRISYAATDAELIGLKGLQPEFSQDRTGLQVLRQLTAQRIVRALQQPSIRRIRVATKVVAPERSVETFGPVIVIRRGANELRYYNGARLVRTFGVATGQTVYPTPTGTFEIVDMHAQPVVGASTGLTVGKGLEADLRPDRGIRSAHAGWDSRLPGVGIHGTPDDASIGYSAVTRLHSNAHPGRRVGCLNHVEVGVPVVITDA